MARQSPHRGPAMSSQDQVCLGTKLGGRCQDSHIHSSAGVAVRGEEERDAIHRAPWDSGPLCPWRNGQGRNGFPDGRNNLGKIPETLTVQAGMQNVRVDQAKMGKALLCR